MGAKAKTQTGRKTLRGKWANIDTDRLPLAVLSIFIRKKYRLLFFVLKLSASGRSHADSLFNNEEQELSLIHI